MFVVPLHAGVEHPNLLLIVFSSLFAFLAGIGVGSYSQQIREFVQTLTAASDSTA
jgi:hypothetical protein